MLKENLVSAPVLTLPVSGKEFTIYSDASIQDLGCVLMREEKVILYISIVKTSWKNYSMHDLELAAVILVLKL